MASYEKNLTLLLQAEEEANKIIRAAEDKREKMKEEAHQRAKEEIEELREQMQADFESRKVDTTKEEKDIAQMTEVAIQRNEEDYQANKDKVVDLLVERILHVRYELPRNVKADFEILKNE